jgi:hypothetical protein
LQLFNRNKKGSWIQPIEAIETNGIVVQNQGCYDQQQQQQTIARLTFLLAEVVTE